MTNFIMSDDRWAHLRLGYTEDGDYTVARTGSALVCVAQALTLSGYQATPAEVVEACQDGHLVTVDGKLLWDRLPTIFPQMIELTDNQGAFVFLKGKRKGYDHWVLDYQKTIYDPMDGTNDLLPEFTETGEIHTFNITKGPHGILTTRPKLG